MYNKTEYSNRIKAAAKRLKDYEELKDISNFLSDELSKFVDLVEQKDREIERLKEIIKGYEE